MARGRPKSDEPTCVLAVRVPMALREQLDQGQPRPPPRVEAP